MPPDADAPRPRTGTLPDSGDSCVIRRTPDPESRLGTGLVRGEHRRRLGLRAPEQGLHLGVALLEIDGQSIGIW